MGFLFPSSVYKEYIKAQKGKHQQEVMVGA
jgi:hypothetical protein